MWLLLKTCLLLPNSTVECCRPVDNKAVFDETEGQVMVQCMTVKL